MRILMSSYVYPPSMGGIETVSELLARSFSDLGHPTTVVTQTPPGDTKPSATMPPFPLLQVIRRPTPIKLCSLLRQCDIYFHNHLSLRSSWPLLFISKPWAVATHTWLYNKNSKILNAQIKNWAISQATNISVSNAIAEHLPCPSVIIPNPIDFSFFRKIKGVERSKDFICVGRLVKDKGVDLLIQALAILKKKDLQPSLCIIGSGPELETLKRLTTELDLSNQVTLTGKLSGGDLIKSLNAHRILVAPSRWKEPFGLVAVEGLACGCVPLVSDYGGLPEAIGPCGLTFKHNNPQDLAKQMQKLLQQPQLQCQLLKGVKQHLAKHEPQHVTEGYLDLFRDAIALKYHFK